MGTNPKRAQVPARETIGQRLKRARTEAGMSARDVKIKILEDYGQKVGETTISQMERDLPPNPGLKTIEIHALGLGLDPLEVLSLGLDKPRNLHPGYSQSHFARLWESYARLSIERRPFWDQFIGMLTERMNRQG